MVATPTRLAQPTEALAGLVERVTFHNEDSGFCVMRVKARGQRDLVTVTAHTVTVAAGEWVQMSGAWVNDRTHGLQFKARFLKGKSTDHARRYRALSRVRDDPRHRTRVRQAAGAGVR